jgi:hypothetical protein
VPAKNCSRGGRVVVADSAHPAQSKSGIQTIGVGEDQISVVHKVLDAIVEARHVRANVYTESELSFAEENDTPEIEAYRG